MPGRCLKLAAWIITAGLVGTEIGEAICAPAALPAAVDGVLDSLTAASVICMVLWTLADRYLALRPGTRIVSDTEYHLSEEAIARGLAAGMRRDGDDGKRRLRSV